MVEWYNSLTTLELIYFYIACIATVFLIVQIVLACLSFGGGADADIDVDVDGDFDVDAGVSIFTVKSLTAFFAVGSWVGLLMCSILPHLQWLSAIIAVICGFAAMMMVFFIMRWIAKLQTNGLFDMENLIGKTATVYVSIPQKRTGRGKITLTAQGKYVELDAICDEEEKILVDQIVEIVSKNLIKENIKND